MIGKTGFRVILLATILFVLVVSILRFLSRNYDLNHLQAPLPPDQTHRTVTRQHISDTHDLYRHLIGQYITKHQNINDEIDPQYEVIKEHDQLVFQVDGYFRSNGEYVPFKETVPREKLMPHRSYLRENLDNTILFHRMAQNRMCLDGLPRLSFAFNLRIQYLNKQRKRTTPACRTRTRTLNVITLRSHAGEEEFGNYDATI